MKILTDEDTKFKGLERYLSLKNRFNKPDINQRYEDIYRQPYSIGFVSKFFKKHKPTSLENAYDLYTISGILDSDMPKTDRGRTKEEIEEMAIEWQKCTVPEIPLVDYYDAIVLHAVIETCFGNIMEREARGIYEEHGYRTMETSGDDDRRLGIDFIAYNEKKRFLVQVKPDSFFRGEKSDLVSDRYWAWKKHDDGIAVYGGSYAYMIYTKDGKWISKDGRMNFRYSELVDKNGHMKVNIDDYGKS